MNTGIKYFDLDVAYYGHNKTFLITLYAFDGDINIVFGMELWRDEKYVLDITGTRAIANALDMITGLGHGNTPRKVSYTMGANDQLGFQSKQAIERAFKANADATIVQSA